VLRIQLTFWSLRCLC